MQMALDAMMTIRPYEVVDYDQLEASITALRERLARPNEFEPDWDQVEALQESLREHMAEIHRLRQWQGLTDQEIIPAKDKGKLGTGNCDIPLYTAPPKKQWVGLTADEIWKCNRASGSAVEFHICYEHQNVLDFAESIEEKLKEKNT